MPAFTGKARTAPLKSTPGRTDDTEDASVNVALNRSR